MLRLFICLLLLSLQAQAQTTTVNLSCTLPTKNTDESDIPATGPTSLNTLGVLYSACADADLDLVNALEYKQVVEDSADLVCSAAIEIGVPGDWCFRAYVRSVNDIRSDLSNLVVKNVQPAWPPNPPLELSITEEDMQVFSVLRRPGPAQNAPARFENVGWFLTAPIGTAPAGTPCDSSQKLNGMYSIPVDAVVMTTGGEPPIIAMAFCE